MEEMGFQTSLEQTFSFIYKTGFENGLTEHEVDHVFIGHYDKEIVPHPDEVASYAFHPMDFIRQSIADKPHLYTSWFKIAFPKLETYLASA